MADQKIHVEIKDLKDPGDFTPSGITVVFKFAGHITESRTYWHNGSGDVEDIPDDWKEEGVTVNGIHVPLDAAIHPVGTLHAKYEATEYPSGSGYRTLWVVINP